jgi:hypothetical protein
MRYLLLALLFSNVIFAGDKNQYSNGCFFTTIQIANHTGDICKISTKEIIHGALAGLTSIPNNILPGDSKTFIMARYYGLEVNLNYQCGYNSLHFKVKRPFYIFSASEITFNVIDSNGLQASYIKDDGSCFWGVAGVIDVNLFN